jgi:hypothetical protein
MQLRVDDLVLTFEDGTRFETFDDPANYHGVDFFLADGKYEVLSSKLGMRLLINLADGYNKDVPFHEGTFHMLPGVQVTREAPSSSG